MAQLLRPGSALVAVLLVALFVSDAPAQCQKKAPAKSAATAPQSITVQSRVLDSFCAYETTSRRVGALQFRGGLVLTSSSRDFGGLSGIRLDPTGEHFIAIS